MFCPQSARSIARYLANVPTAIFLWFPLVNRLTEPGTLAGSLMDAHEEGDKNDLDVLDQDRLSRPCRDWSSAGAIAGSRNTFLRHGPKSSRPPRMRNSIGWWSVPREREAEAREILQKRGRNEIGSATAPAPMPEIRPSFMRCLRYPKKP